MSRPAPVGGPSQAGDFLAQLSASAPRSLPGIVVAVILIGLSFGTGVLVGRQSAVRAADLDAERPAAEVDVPQAAGLVPEVQREPVSIPVQPATTDPRAPVSALMDPDNEYTIAVVTYGATQEDLAFAAYDHLAESGLPVFDPYLVGSNIVLLVGAAERSEDLVDLERRVRALSRDGIRGVYGDAYRLRIDQYVDR